MDKLRQAANSLAIKIILALVILGLVVSSIIGFGTGFLGGNSIPEDAVISVDGKTLTKGAIVRSIYLNQKLSNGQLNQAQIQDKEEKNFLFSLIYDKFDGATPSDSLISKIVTQSPQFQVDGKYNNQAYLDILNSTDYSGEQYVSEQVIPTIKSTVVVDGVIDSEFVLPSDISLLNSLAKQERKIKIANLNMSDVISPDSVVITAEQEKEYYDAHLKEFEKSEQYKIKYIHITKSDFDKNIDRSSITENDAKAYYDNNQSLFEEPAQRRFHLIVVNDASKVSEIQNRLNQNENFDDLAKEYSILPNNIDTGWISETDITTLFPDYSSLTNKGSYKMIENNNGNYQFIQLNDLREKGVAPFETVKEQIIDRLWQDKVTNGYKTELARLESTNPEAYTSLEAYLSENNLPASVIESNWNTEKDAIFNIPEIKSILSDGSLYTSKGSTNKISPIVYTNQGNDVYLLQVSEYKPEEITSLDIVSAEINQKLKQAEMEKRFNEKVNEIYNDLSQGKMSDLLKFNSDYDVVRNVQTQGLNSNVLAEVFTLIPNEKNFGMVQTSPTNAQFIELISIKDTPLPDSELAQVKFNIDTTLKNTLFFALYAEVVPKEWLTIQ